MSVELGVSDTFEEWALVQLEEAIPSKVKCLEQQGKKTKKRIKNLAAKKRIKDLAGKVKRLEQQDKKASQRIKNLAVYFESLVEALFSLALARRSSSKLTQGPEECLRRIALGAETAGFDLLATLLRRECYRLSRWWGRLILAKLLDNVIRTWRPCNALDTFPERYSQFLRLFKEEPQVCEDAFNKLFREGQIEERIVGFALLTLVAEQPWAHQYIPAAEEVLDMIIDYKTENDERRKESILAVLHPSDREIWLEYFTGEEGENSVFYASLFIAKTDPQVDRLKTFMNLMIDRDTSRDFVLSLFSAVADAKTDYAASWASEIRRRLYTDAPTCLDYWRDQLLGKMKEEGYGGEEEEEEEATSDSEGDDVEDEDMDMDM